MRRAVPLSVLCFGLLFARGAAAQSAVAGSVTDGTGAVLPGGTWSQQSGLDRESPARRDSDGPDLPAVGWILFCYSSGCFRDP